MICEQWAIHTIVCMNIFHVERCMNCTIRESFFSYIRRSYSIRILFWFTRRYPRKSNISIKTEQIFTSQCKIGTKTFNLWHVNMNHFNKHLSTINLNHSNQKLTKHKYHSIISHAHTQWIAQHSNLCFLFLHLFILLLLLILLLCIHSKGTRTNQ